MRRRSPGLHGLAGCVATTSPTRGKGRNVKTNNAAEPPPSAIGSLETRGAPTPPPSVSHGSFVNDNPTLIASEPLFCTNGDSPHPPMHLSSHSGGALYQTTNTLFARGRGGRKVDLRATGACTRGTTESVGSAPPVLGTMRKSPLASQTSTGRSTDGGMKVKAGRSHAFTGAAGGARQNSSSHVYVPRLGYNTANGGPPSGLRPGPRTSLTNNNASFLQPAHERRSEPLRATKLVSLGLPRQSSNRKYSHNADGAGSGYGGQPRTRVAQSWTAFSDSSVNSAGNTGVQSTGSPQIDIERTFCTSQTFSGFRLGSRGNERRELNGGYLVQVEGGGPDCIAEEPALGQRAPLPLACLLSGPHRYEGANNTNVGRSDEVSVASGSGADLGHTPLLTSKSKGAPNSSSPREISALVASSAAGESSSGCSGANPKFCGSQPKYEFRVVVSSGKTSSTPIELSIGTGAVQGLRPTMEDEHFASLNRKVVRDQPVSLLGILDGHCGRRVAELGSKVLPEFFFSHAALGDNNALAMVESILQADRSIYHSLSRGSGVGAAGGAGGGLFGTSSFVSAQTGADGGSTLIAAAVHGRMLYVACLGDARAVLYDGRTTIAMSEDHKPGNAKESSRIARCGGFVQFGRVCGVLAVSRALGDFEFKFSGGGPAGAYGTMGGHRSKDANRFVLDRELMVSNVADVRQLHLTDETKFLILACDGLWDVVSNEEATQFVKDFLTYTPEINLAASGPCDTGKRPKPPASVITSALNNCCQKLAEFAVDRGSTDNVSVMLLFFHDVVDVVAELNRSTSPRRGSPSRSPSLQTSHSTGATFTKQSLPIQSGATRRGSDNMQNSVVARSSREYGSGQMQQLTKPSLPPHPPPSRDPRGRPPPSVRERFKGSFNGAPPPSWSGRSRPLW